MNETNSQYETRIIENPGMELRTVEGKPPMLVGYAAVYNSPSADLGGFKEVIAPGAFTTSLAGKDDIRALISHDASKLLGRTSNNTLRLSEDTKGLRCEIDIPDTSYGRDLMALVRRGDLRQMSFGFKVAGGGQKITKDNSGNVTRTLSNVSLKEVSCVDRPAYTETSLQVRIDPSVLESITSNNSRKNYARCAKNLRYTLLRG